MRIFRIAAVFGICLCAILLPVEQGQSSGLQHATFIDVGQGDSIHLSDGQGFDVLIDGGVSSAGTTVLNYLRANGITQLDAMVATHADADHVGGLISVLLANDITVSQVYYNGYSGTTVTWDNFTAAVAGDGLALTPLQFPADLDWGAMSAHVLHPPAGLSNPGTNEASIVLRVDYGAVSYLLTGDIDSDVESEILGRATPVAAEILKAAHHGSRNGSSEVFLAAVSPDEAVISVGENNPYEHPHQETLDRLAAVGAFIWRTDISEDVRVENTGSCYTIYDQRYGNLRSTCGVGSVGWAVYLPLIVKSDPTPPGPNPTPTPKPTGPPVSSTGRIEILSIYFNGAGTAEPDEFVEIKNVDDHSIRLAGWTLSDAANHVYTFPDRVMTPGQTCRVYTNQHHPEWCGFSYGSKAAIWNNTGDTATLRNAQGTVIDTYEY